MLLWAELGAENESALFPGFSSSFCSFKACAKPRYASNSSWNAFRLWKMVVPCTTSPYPAKWSRETQLWTLGLPRFTKSSPMAMAQVLSRLSQEVLTPFSWTKFPKKDAKFEAKFPNIFWNLPLNSPRSYWCFPVTSKSLTPQISPDISHQKFQISNQISPKKLHSALLQAWQP